MVSKKINYTNFGAIKIDTDVSIPERKSKTLYPFDALKPGHSFYIPGGKYANLQNVARNYCLNNSTPTLQLKFLVAPVEADTKTPMKTTETGVGVRVWRVN